MDLGIKQIAELCDLGLDNTNPEMELLELDVAADYAYCEVTFERLNNLNRAFSTMERIIDYIDNNGCSNELVALVGEDLNQYGIEIFPGKPEEAKVAIEGVIDDIKKGDFKAALTKIVDAIVRIVQKFNDTNKQHINRHDEAIRGRLSDISKFDPQKFQVAMVSIYPPKDFNYIVGEYSKIDYRRYTNVTSKDQKLSDILKKAERLLNAVGYKLGENDIERDEDFSIERKKMSEHGWQLSNIKKMVVDTKTMLEHVRVQGRKATVGLRRDVRSLKDDDQEEAELLKLELRAVMKLITVVERTSLVISSQVFNVVNALKEKR